MKEFSFKQRPQTMATLQKETLDVFIIGGGITGAGIALDAVTRGMSVGLVDMQDFASGTSSRSTKLVHGGLRYLKQMRIKEVAELGRERAIVYANGPHVTTPIWMLLPFYKGGSFGPLATAFGLKVYDVLAGVKKSERRFMLSKDMALQQEPLLKKEDLVGAGMYVEYRTDDARLTIEVLKAAVEHGAYAVNYMKVIKMDTQNLAFTKVTVEDQFTKEQYVIKAKKVINASGPWVDEVRKLEAGLTEKHLILSKGVHVVFDQQDFPLQQAIYFDTQNDGRMIFAIPRDGKTYVGTTDTFYNGAPEEVKITANDKKYLLQAIHFMFPHLQLTERQIESCWAGVRPLIHEKGENPSEISRKDEVWQSEQGLITIAGGKLTGYRKMAEKIVDLVSKQLSIEYHQTYSSCITKKLPISGGDLSGSAFFEQYVERQITSGVQIGLKLEQSEKIVRRYGTNSAQVFRFAEQNDTPLDAVTYGELHYAMHYEAIAKPVDFFIRRTGALLFTIHQVNDMKEAVLDEMAKSFHWTTLQKSDYRKELQEAIDEVVSNN
ncbi:glycerol-3-phosphate dehydrogenase [Solibacillus sp. R5-41]|uniref:glycerol-3-phosphate dehydrogenase/oxidase n=1 Tax=Solibacillus sp. R5-41 TaxID=2048654 RepID=UPI000C1271AE|nr:FAD-dependent oxidoreductase [Solibacillus sp. R5-41]ATP40950.1 glycerol-3-phosphate dehydrogenase [Solibacillus sp. R5-41]